MMAKTYILIARNYKTIDVGWRLALGDSFVLFFFLPVYISV